MIVFDDAWSLPLQASPDDYNATRLYAEAVWFMHSDDSMRGKVTRASFRNEHLLHAGLWLRDGPLRLLHARRRRCRCCQDRRLDRQHHGRERWNRELTVCHWSSDCRHTEGKG